MKYFLAVVPPAELTTQIELFRAELAPAALPAHITVKAPNSLAATEQWLPQVQTLCQGIGPIAVRLDGFGQFSSTVVYWQVISAGIVDMHQALLSIINPPPPERVAYFEGPAYVPHLTLAYLNNKVGAATLTALSQRAAKLWPQPVDFVAQTVRVFRTSGENHTYEPYLDLPLAGKPIAAKKN